MYLILRIAKAFVNDNTNAPLLLRTITLKAAPIQIGTSIGLNVYGLCVYNPNTVDVFVRIYSSAASPVVGTAGIVTAMRMVPAGGQIVLQGTDILWTLASKGWVAATTGYLDSDTAAPATNLICEITYK